MFGNKIHVFCGDDFYFCIQLERGEIYYSVIDKNLQYLYPINTLMKKNEFKYDFADSNNEIDFLIDIDLNTLGRTYCPLLITKLIQDSL